MKRIAGTVATPQIARAKRSTQRVHLEAEEIGVAAAGRVALGASPLGPPQSIAC